MQKLLKIKKFLSNKRRKKRKKEESHQTKKQIYQ